MKFLYPIAKEDGTEFKDQQEFEHQVKKESIGQFGYNPNNNSWHGGLHFTEKNAAWIKDQKPVRAIADGCVVACRVNNQYQISNFKGAELSYSNDFCLLQHSYTNPSDSSEKFTFYSLYMHLAPACIPHREQSDNQRFLMTENRNARPSAGLADEKTTLESGCIIEATNDNEVAADGYIFKPFTIINNKDNKDELAVEGNKLWIATYKEKQPQDITSTFLKNSHYTIRQYQDSQCVDVKVSCMELIERRNVRSVADINSISFTLPIGAKVVKQRDIGEKRSGNYMMSAYKIIDNKDSISTSVNVSPEATVWIADSKIPAPDNLFNGFTRPYQLPKWIYTEVLAETITDSLRGRTDPAVNNGVIEAGEHQYDIPKGTLIKYSRAKDCSLQNIGNSTYLMARCSFPNNDVIKDGQVVRAAWLCVEEQFVKVIKAEPVEFNKVNSFGKNSKLFVKAGDEIGYLGRFDAAALNTPQLFDTRHQVHFEMFSVDKPPAYFTDAFLGENEDCNTLKELKFIEDVESCDGFLDQDEPSSFFKELVQKLNLGEEDIPGSDIIENLTPWDSCKYVVAKHESEWAAKSDEKPFLDKLVEQYGNPEFKSLIEHEKSRIDNLIWMPDVESDLGQAKEVWNWWPIPDRAVHQVSEAELYVRAFMRMIRVGEGTVGNKGYETLFGGKSFIKDYDKSWDDHPRIHRPFGNTTSTAAGAYQVMEKTWDDDNMVARRRKYKVDDFSPRNQDLFGVILLKYKRRYAWPLLISGNIEESISLDEGGEKRGYAYEWASLPTSPYGQPQKTMEDALSIFEEYLEQERNGDSDLKLEHGFLEVFL
ncbi:glycoside hydrolase family 24 protein [Vibrio sp. TRT 21S02]|uniref:glycoside hydrolase family 24 protein n=1 Tax=Vibrio sp. TRT 21S02 TaxID=3418507 RepID=UPI003CF1671F